jgi:hypothetical protein
LKYAATGKVYPWKNITAISDEQIQKYKKLIESHGIKVDIGR